MPPLNLAPTRRNYLELTHALERVQEGHELLEQKRQILILELMEQVEAAGRVKEQVAQAMAAAHEALRAAAVQGGMAALMRRALGAAMEHSLRFRSRSVMGVPVPEIDCEPAPLTAQFGLSDGQSAADQVVQRFLEAIPLVAELAQVENAVFRLAREVRRTQRRVNALEKTFIPQYKETLRFIDGVLEERQREEFIVLRKVKRRRQAAARAATTRPSSKAR
jgi:V/A-type H+-transporting ATPase subunit D